MQNLTPREIVSELDRHIIGQNGAKRAVAIALRNRWRRKQAPEALRNEITPKNILMIGPTGVGKTEVSRRLAKLANALNAVAHSRLTLPEGDVVGQTARFEGVIALKGDAQSVELVPTQLQIGE